MAAGLVEVPFTVTAETSHGAAVRLVGSLANLGSWNPEDGVVFSTTPQTYPSWSATVRLPADAVASGSIEYKFVMTWPNGRVQWEEGIKNRLLQHSSKPMSHVFGQEDKKPDALPCPVVMSEVGTRIVFEAECSHTLPGDCLMVLGADEALGAWVPSRALRLATSPTTFPRWCGAASFSPGTSFGAWKLAILHADGILEWEPIEDRATSLPCQRSAEVLIVRAVFGQEGQSARAEVATLSELSTPLVGECLKRCGGKPSDMDIKCALMERASSTESTIESTIEGSEASDDCKHSLSRPSSTASTASTCSSEDDRDAHVAEAWSFTKQVFDGLFPAGDLRQRLAGKVVAQEVSSEGNRPFWLWSGAHRIQKPCGRCEDAFFHSAKALGVADGVGSMVQFAKYGADAAAYAAELMESASAACDRLAEMRNECEPDERATAAVRAAEVEARSYGASTITVLALEQEKVGVANLGDSGFMVLRRGPEGLFIVTQSEEQQHHWNCPYQLARLPPALEKRLPKGQKMDTAADCQRYKVQVQPGDLLLLYTDGMCDNIHEQELLEIANRALAPAHSELAGLTGFATPPESVARALALAAKERSLDITAAVPFWEASRRHGLDAGLGGKPDDITVVAAWVMPEATPSANHAALHPAAH